MSQNPSSFIPTPYEPSAPASFTPTQGNYKNLQPFRYWCQKVLPLVYDDSLSYYELLCKVVDYLNKTMEDVETLHNDVDNLHTAYGELQNDYNAKYAGMTEWMNQSYQDLVTFVNTYFANLDVQEEINTKLDDMALDGSLSALIEPFLPNLVDTWLGEHITNPSNPPLDTTFKLTNAAAQSAQVGKKCLKHINMTDTIAETTYEGKMGNIEAPSMCWINTSWFDDAPTQINGACWLFTIGSGDTAISAIGSQMLVRTATGECASRQYIQSQSAWGTWNYSPHLIDPIDFKGSLADIVPAITGLNDITETSVYFGTSPNTWENVPASGTFILETYKISTGFVAQKFTLIASGMTYTRYLYGGTWRNWGYLHIDTTFKLLGAAADSQTVGKKIIKKIDMTSDIATNTYSNLMSNIEAPSMCWINTSWFNDSPTQMSGSCWLFTIGEGDHAVNAIGSQILINTNTGETATRQYLQAYSTWGNWVFTVHLNDPIGFKGRLDQISPAITGLNDITETSVYFGTSPNTWENVPIGGTFILETYEISTGFVAQKFTHIATGIIYTRYLYGGTWRAWSALQVDTTFKVSGAAADSQTVGKKIIKKIAMDSDIATNTYSNLMSNIEAPSMAWVNPTWFNDSPDGFTSTSWLFTIGEGDHAVNAIGSQILIKASTGEMASRQYVQSISGWSDWVTYHVNHGHYYAFGDSTTYGYIDANTRSTHNYPNGISKELEMNVHNYGVPGQGLITDWSTIQNDFITNLNMDNANLITVGWAYNDATIYTSMNMGDYDDTTLDSVIGYYYTIMKQFQEKCPSASVILVTGYYRNSVSYNFLDGTKTAHELYDELEKMCHLHGWCCVNQAKGGWVNDFNWSTVIGDNVHPTDNGYKIYSNYMAGRIKALYANLVQ